MLKKLTKILRRPQNFKVQQKPFQISFNIKKKTFHKRDIMEGTRVKQDRTDCNCLLCLQISTFPPVKL